MILKAIDSTLEIKKVFFPVYFTSVWRVCLHIQGTKRAHDWRKQATRKFLFFKTNLFKEWMKKFVALLRKEKGKATMNEWENDDTDILRTFIQCI